MGRRTVICGRPKTRRGFDGFSKGAELVLESQSVVR